MGPSDILTCGIALYGTIVHFNMRFCLIWVPWIFLIAFLPYMGLTDILTCIFALNGTDGYHKMRFCLIWDRRTF